MTGRNAIGTLRCREYYDEYAAKNQTTGKMAVALRIKNGRESGKSRIALKDAERM